MNTDATRAHIDAETMAAWADRALPDDAAAAVELHLSNCERCQEVLAAFIRSEPAAGAVVIPFWARRPVQWSAAGLAAAAALVAMIWIGRPPAVPVPESTVAYRDAAPTGQQPQAAPQAASPAPADPRQDKLANAAIDNLQARAESRRAEGSAAAPARLRDAVGQAAAKKAEGRGAATEALNKESAPSPKPMAGIPTAPPPPPPPPATVMPPVAPPATTATAAAPVLTPLATPAGATRPATRSEAVVMDAFSAVIPIIEITAPEPSPSAMRSIGGAAGRGAGGGARAALSRDAGPTRWRIVAGTRVERTVDAGATWTPLPIEPELKTLLLAGSATSPTNCWLVGRDGVVLVTNDGRTFRRVSVPEVVHLTGVTAQDAMRATVTAIDGRKFSTIDGGQTWK